MCPHHRKRLPRHRRSGVTLTELLITIAVMSLIAVALGALAKAVEQSTTYTRGHGSATQHARVAVQRIQHHINTASATAQFPGFAVISEQEAGWTFPDSLVIWNPSGAAANADGPPLFNELIIYCPNPSHPGQLLEITAPLDTRQTPPLSNASAWRNELASIKSSNTARRVVLLDNLRTAETAEGSSPRGAIRFSQRLRPAEADWNSYQSGSATWQSLPWVQGIYGSQTGLRQAWCSFELQLVAEDDADGSPPTVIPFFGSAALYYQLQR